MKLYQKWLLEQMPQNVNNLSVIKMKLQTRANLIRRKMAGKNKINPKNTHELNVIQAKINRIDRILLKMGQNR